MANSQESVLSRIREGAEEMYDLTVEYRNIIEATTRDPEDWAAGQEMGSKAADVIRLAVHRKEAARERVRAE